MVNYIWQTFHVSTELCLVLKFLYSAVSNPQDCSKHFTSLTDLFNQTPSQLLWEASSHICYNECAKALIHLSTNVYSQFCLCLGVYNSLFYHYFISRQSIVIINNLFVTSYTNKIATYHTGDICKVCVKLTIFTGHIKRTDQCRYRI